MATTLAQVATSSKLLGGMGADLLMTLTLHQNTIQHAISMIRFVSVTRHASTKPACIITAAICTLQLKH